MSSKVLKNLFYFPQPQIEAAPGETLDPRVKRTRQLIVDAFYKLMSEQGFGEITIGDITRQAGINRATFYAHFLDKDALLDYMISQTFHQLLYSRLSPESALSSETLRPLIELSFEFLRQLRPVPVSGECKENSHLVEAEVQRQLKDFLAAWLKNNRHDSPEVTATSLSWAIFGNALEASQGNLKLTPGEVAQSLLVLLTVENKVGAGKS